MQEKSRNSNREKILEAAILLFAERGFSAVSQREIAAAVGIKAASLYNHFPSKEAILEEIVNMLKEGLMQHVMPVFSPAELVPLCEYLEGITITSDALFLSPAFFRIGIIIMREQFHNATVRRMLYEMMLLGPREAISAYFARLMQAGMMRNGDAQFAAKEFHALFVYEFYENALSFGIEAEPRQQTRAGQAHTERFIENWEC